tara:strand:- start:221 stop:835 length:615 start_codon:yes stop_codon:yes gene_type:complete
MQTQNYNKKNYDIILIGHRGHPEVIGIQGQISNKITIVENEEEAKSLKINANKPLAYVTQTTLSMNDTKNIISVLKRKFPDIIGPDLDDICYATQNRQEAVAELASLCDMVLVIGGENSSNTKRLAEIVEKKNVPVYRISSLEEFQKKWLNGVDKLGITAGASSPEVLIDEIISHIQNSYKNVIVETIEGVEEKIRFKPLTEFK